MAEPKWGGICSQWIWRDWRMPQDYGEPKFLSHHPATLPWPHYTVELYRVVLNDLSLSSTEDPSYSTELFLANLLGKKIIIRCKTDLLQKKKY